jgi:cysteinyl-tRNA synthetase
MRLYNTLTRNIDELPHLDSVVRIYLCGVTVYDKSHIGHARTIIVLDLLNRLLRYKAFKVIFVQNFTDVDDKIINKAKEEGKPPEEIAGKFIREYEQDFTRLNVLHADHYPRATDNIAEMTRIISALLAEGHAYLTTKGVYFRVKSFQEYGKLSRKTLEDLLAGARIEVDHNKEHPLDFALWKFSSAPPTYSSPWGSGRPGWHIECSAMVMKYLGNDIEIHAGGNDLIFPHHENEIAQSESYSNQPFAKLWLHCGMVTVSNEKMSKSLGNIISVEKSLARWGSNVTRLFCYSVHYSKPLDYREDIFIEIKHIWNTIENCGWELSSAKGNYNADQLDLIKDLSMRSLNEFEIALENDLNSALALKVFMEFVGKICKITLTTGLAREAAEVAKDTYDRIMHLLGLKLVEISVEERQEVNELISRRSQLRSEKNYEEADKMRTRLQEKYSVELMDRADGTFWKKIEKCTLDFG